jgi:hypothetical protein
LTDQEPTCIAANDTWVVVAFYGAGVCGVRWQADALGDNETFVLASGNERRVREISFDAGDPHHLWLCTDFGPRLLDTSSPLNLFCLANPLAVEGTPWHLDDDVVDALHLHHSVSHKNDDDCELCQQAPLAVERIRARSGTPVPALLMESCDDRRAIVMESVILAFNTSLGTLNQIPVRDGGVVAIRFSADGMWIVWADNMVDHIADNGSGVQFFEMPDTCAVDWSKVRNPASRVSSCYGGLRIIASPNVMVKFVL